MGRQEIQHNECSICGDVGFAKDLLLCHKCNYRFQHTYCSRLYPNLDLESWACEWCLYLQDRKNTAAETGKIKAKGLPESRNTAFEFLLQIAESSPEGINIEVDANNGSCRKDGVELNRGTVSEQANQVWKEESRSDCRDSEEEIRPLRICKEEINSFNCRRPAKRQRCDHPTSDKKKSASLGGRWGHLTGNKVHCNPIRRRYKLLTDVLC